MTYAFTIPRSVRSVPAYLNGRIYALWNDEPPCHGWLKDRGLQPLPVLNWMQGFADEKREQGWPDLIDWRGGSCMCGRCAS